MSSHSLNFLKLDIGVLNTLCSQPKKDLQYCAVGAFFPLVMDVFKAMYEASEKLVSSSVQY